MKVTTEINTFDELYKQSWSGAIDTLNDIQNADKEEELMRHLEEVFGYDEEPISDVGLNDYLWHDRESVYDAVGLDENGEIPNALTTAKNENTTWLLSLEDIDNMKESGLFDTKLLVYLTNKCKDSFNELYTTDVSDLEINTDDEITEEHIEWLNDNI